MKIYTNIYTTLTHNTHTHHTCSHISYKNTPGDEEVPGKTAMLLDVYFQKSDAAGDLSLCRHRHCYPAENRWFLLHHVGLNQMKIGACDVSVEQCHWQSLQSAMSFHKSQRRCTLSIRSVSRNRIEERR